MAARPKREEYWNDLKPSYLLAGRPTAPFTGMG